MAWPTSKPNSTAFDSADDSISTSRAELKTMSDAVNNIVDFVDTSGIVNGDVLVYDSTSGTIKPGTNYQLLNIVAGTNVTVTQPDSTGSVTISATGGLADIIEDTTPQLGGNLDLNGFSISNAKLTGITKIELNDDVNVTGNLTGSSGSNNFNISSEGTTGGSTTIWNDASQEGYIKVGEGDIIIAPSQDSATKGTVDLQIPTSSSASAGANTLPSNPVGFLGIKINGTDYKVPYYNT